MPTISVELLTGDTSFANYFNPIGFITMNIGYSAALLIRETVVRWNKGFTSVLILAAGYGMVNEATGSKGFFDPHFYAVTGGGLKSFGRYFGVNVPWALNISIFHAVFSMIVPLVIVSAIFPGSNRWIGNKLYAVLLGALVAVSAVTFEFFTIPPSHYHYDEGPGPILLVLVLIAILILLAWKVPTLHSSRWQLRTNVFTLFVVGAVYTIAYYFLPSHVQTATGSPVIYIVFLLVVFVALPISLIFKLPEPTARGKVALAAGLLAPLLVISTVKVGLIPAAIVLALIAIAFVRASSET
jgi:hypothetical protein